MDKTALGVLGALSALATFDAAAAGPVRPAASFAELLAPIPNAAATLRQADAVKPPAAAPPADEDTPITRAGAPRPRPKPAPTTTGQPAAPKGPPKVVAPAAG